MRKKGVHQKTPMGFLLVTLSYLVASTAAKYLHEIGHAVVAWYLGVPPESMTIVVNPFGSGLFRPTNFGFPVSTWENGLFTLNGLLFPAALLILLSLATRKADPAARWFVGLLLGYSLLSNAVNLLSGLVTRSSDGGFLLFLGMPVWVLISICAVAGLAGAVVLVREVFLVLLASVKGVGRRLIVFSGFAVSGVLGVVLIGIIDNAVRRRLFFAACEIGLLAALFGISLWFEKQSQKEPEDFVSPTSFWVFLTVGSVGGFGLLVQYLLSGMGKN